MSNIIFKEKVPNNMLYDFLNIYCTYENQYYIIDNIIFKQYIYDVDYVGNFFNELQKYYKDSKKFYLKRRKSYNNLLTIIRQICKYNNIPYSSKIKYDKNKYNIIYSIKKIESISI
tara:strand:+ start:1577 stop:1924 length:348 start_codon:yes stop_codon:yes gene_type:complete